MSNKEKELLNSICESVKKATPSQREFMKGFAEGLAYASETRNENENDNQNHE